MRMAQTEKSGLPTLAHNLILEGRSKLSLSGVTDVDSFDDQEISLQTGQGALLVRGSGLHIEKLSVDAGELTVTGLVTELCYEETAQSGSLWSRLFR